MENLTAPFIALAFMLLGVIIALRVTLDKYNKLKRELQFMKDNDFRKISKVYDRHFRFVNAECHSTEMLNKIVTELQAQGYKYRREENPGNGILCFVKYEEVKKTN